MITWSNSNTKDSLHRAIVYICDLCQFKFENGSEPVQNKLLHCSYLEVAPGGLVTAQLLAFGVDIKHSEEAEFHIEMATGALPSSVCGSGSDRN